MRYLGHSLFKRCGSSEGVFCVFALTALFFAWGSPGAFQFHRESSSQMNVPLSASKIAYSELTALDKVLTRSMGGRRNSEQIRASAQVRFVMRTLVMVWWEIVGRSLCGPKRRGWEVKLRCSASFALVDSGDVSLDLLSNACCSIAKALRLLSDRPAVHW